MTRDIVLVLAFKAAALALLYAAFFGPAYRVPVTADRLAALFAAPAPIAENR